jgi:hypothetical protein
VSATRPKLLTNAKLIITHLQLPSYQAYSKNREFAQSWILTLDLSFIYGLWSLKKHQNFAKISVSKILLDGAGDEESYLVSFKNIK